MSHGIKWFVRDPPAGVRINIPDRPAKRLSVRSRQKGIHGHLRPTANLSDDSINMLRKW